MYLKKYFNELTDKEIISAQKTGKRFEKESAVNPFTMENRNGREVPTPCVYCYFVEKDEIIGMLEIETTTRYNDYVIISPSWEEYKNTFKIDIERYNKAVKDGIINPAR